MINQTKKNPIEKQAEIPMLMNGASNAPNRADSQAFITHRCTDICQNMSSFMFQRNVSECYNDYDLMVTEILSMNFDFLNFPFHTFNSNSIPRILTILMKSFPNTELFCKAVTLSELLSRGICAKQFCQNDFIPILHHFLISSNFRLPNEVILVTIKTLSNIFNYSDDGLIKNKEIIFDLLFRLLQQPLCCDEILIEMVFSVFSGMLKYHQYYDLVFLVNILPFFIKFVSADLTQSFSRALFNIHQIIEISPKAIQSINISMEEFLYQILHLVSNGQTPKIKQFSILIIISIIRRCPVEMKQFIYDNFSWDQFSIIWRENSLEDVKESLLELFYYFIIDNRQIIRSALQANLVMLFLDAFNTNGSYNFTSKIVLCLIKIAIMNIDQCFLLFLLENSFLELIDNFLDSEENDLISYIIRFYLFFLQQIENGIINAQNFDFDHVHDRLDGLTLKNRETIKKREVVFKQIESLLKVE